MNFTALLQEKPSIIGVIHLAALPGSPAYGGSIQRVIDQASQEAMIYQKLGLHAIIVENFNDAPFYPDRVPAETIAAMAVLANEVIRATSMPIGINVLRNDAESAIAIAAATQADFIRVNVHMNAVVSDQGIIEANAHRSLRLRTSLGSSAAVLADVGVKHASPLAGRGLALEAEDMAERGMVDGIIISGSRTGSPTSVEDLRMVKERSNLPVIVGSGAKPKFLASLSQYADAFIVGSYFKKAGKVRNPLDKRRISKFMETVASL